jgi:hypothetical protein
LSELVRLDGGSAEFFDEHRRSRGAAASVVVRPTSLSGLTALDVAGADGGLTHFLYGLDKARLTIRNAATGAAWFTFRWASGYSNGDGIRVQGLLEDASRWR